MFNHLARYAAALAMAAVACLPAHAADTYPTRSIRLLVPFSPGGGIDQLARIAAVKMSEDLKQQVVVENMAGAGGAIAAKTVANAAPDGYTLIFNSSSAVATGLLGKDRLGFDPVKDFAPVSLVAQFPLVMVVNPKVPARNMKEFVALLKKNPDKYNYGSSGNGTAIHLASELFKTLAGVSMQHVPYKGTAAAMQDLLGGRIHMMLDGVPPQIGNIHEGRVRALGVTTTERSPMLPDVPTVAEAVPGYAFPFWVAIYAPAATPQPIVDRLAAAVSAAAKDPQSRQRFKDAGADAVGSSPAELATFWQQQIELYSNIVRDTGIKLDGE